MPGDSFGSCKLALAMFPYIDTSQWHLGSLSIHPFIILVTLACAAGWLITGRRAARDGFSQDQALPVSVSIGGISVTNLQFLGEVPGEVAGLLQINVTIPPTAAVGVVPLVVTVAQPPASPV